MGWYNDKEINTMHELFQDKFSNSNGYVNNLDIDRVGNALGLSKHETRLLVEQELQNWHVLAMHYLNDGRVGEIWFGEPSVYRR